MRSPSFSQCTDEVTPMVSTGISIRNNGAILPLSTNAEKELGIDSVCRSRSRSIYVLLILLVPLMLVGIVISAIVLIRLGVVESQVETHEDVINRFRSSFTYDHPAIQVAKAAVSGHGAQRNREDLLSFGTSECPTKCMRRDFEKPPLVVLSLDGFARQYLDDFKVPTLDYIAKCGARAERVYPPYPSRTFPSHYTMVTGLYPESHGIVDNNIFDPNISSKLESMKAESAQGFYQGDPIWNVYKRSGGRAHCLFWPGCSFNVSGLRPDVSPAYNKDLPFRNRFERILDWLLLPPEKRPGLITAYLDQPDSAGHYQIDDKDIEAQLALLETALSSFMFSLRKQGLLSCINLIIVSDHGMQRLGNTYYFSELLKTSGTVTSSGVIGRIHKHKSAASMQQLMEPFECDRGNKWKIFSRSTIPTRKHHQRSSRVGDVIVEGSPGTSFYTTPAQDWHLSGDHGYDYLHPAMHAIFFAMGPSIRKQVVLPPIQNIEYMNLFMDLLGLRTNVPNNGTKGIMDEILVKPPLRTPQFQRPLNECPVTGIAGAVPCDERSCSTEEINRLSASLVCDKPALFPVQIFSTIPRCFQNYCEKYIVVGSTREDDVAVVERLMAAESRSFSCVFVNSKYGNMCKEMPNATEHVRKTLSGDSTSELANIRPLMMSWKKGFVSEILKPLNEYTKLLTEKLGHFVTITGTAFDQDFDGIADTEKSATPSHIFRVLVACAGGAWSADGTSCSNPSDTMVLSFIFPIMEKDINCLPKDELLRDYTARLLDVELITGLIFHFPNIPQMQLSRLKSHVATELW
ncbi:unnamed protein product [Cylicocyclus nassatus]|uniref:Uncharacterized protein n=1 Tax=Cylicocyclus nassatus TaxID=53992 RepID=A0AA36DRR4_CYLNA|nr:unnamed protein product [Cylicocyclus nassatus]